MDYDVITAGGGIAGSTLGKFLAAENLKVLIIEKEVQFRDRVRGEGIWAAFCMRRESQSRSNS